MPFELLPIIGYDINMYFALPYYNKEAERFTHPNLEFIYELSFLKQ